MKIVLLLGGVVVLGVIGYFALGTETNDSVSNDDAPSQLDMATPEDSNVVDDATMVEGEPDMMNDTEPTTAVEETTDESAVDEEMIDGEMTDSEIEPTTKEFTLDSFNFGYSKTELTVQEGDTVTINLTSSDGFHDWVVDEFDAATEKIREGDTTSVTFVADAAGSYEFYCSVGNHREQGMVGTLIVEPAS